MTLTANRSVADRRTVVTKQWRRAFARASLDQADGPDNKFLGGLGKGLVERGDGVGRLRAFGLR